MFNVKFKKKNNKPEKLVEDEVTAWLKLNGFDFTIVESKATYSRKAKAYLKSPTSESLPDIVANFGIMSVWIELKAKGKRSSINKAKSIHQKKFLKRKIDQGCFACVTDSAQHLSKLWNDFKSLQNNADRIILLTNDLPKSKIEKNIFN